MENNNRNFRVKENVDGPMGIQFKKGQEIQIVRNMIYISGFPLQTNYQTAVSTWISSNKNLLIDIT